MPIVKKNSIPFQQNYFLTHYWDLVYSSCSGYILNKPLAEAICAQWSVSWEHVDWVVEVCGIRCGAWPLRESNSHTDALYIRLWKMSLPRGLSTQRRKLDSFPRHCRHAITGQNIDSLRQTHILKDLLFGYKRKKIEISYFFLFTFRMWLFSVFTKCHTLLSTSQFKISITAPLRFSEKAHLEEMIISPLCDFFPNDGDALANC